MTRLVTLFAFRSVSLFLLGMLLGCEPVKQIQSYDVPKEEAVYDANHLEPGGPVDAQGNELPVTDRMLAAYIPHGKTAWFVKLSGPKEAVAPQVDAFRKFVESVKFTGKEGTEPEWNAPEKWQRKAVQAAKAAQVPRRATFTIADTEPPLEVVITSLEFEADTPLYLLQNVNRWRGQLSLPKIPRPRLNKDTTTVKLAAGRAVLVDFQGHLQSPGMGAPLAGHPPIAGNPGEAPGPPRVKQPETGAPPAATGGLKYDLPAGWRLAKQDLFSQLAFEAGPAESPVRVTFTPAAGSLEANIGRWCDQVGIPHLTAEELTEKVEKIEIAGVPAAYVQLIGKESTILGVVANLQGQTLFIKLRGPNATAAEQQAKYRELLKSIRLE